jgi:hypothetical protein
LACGIQPADEKLLNRRKSRRRPDLRPTRHKYSTFRQQCAETMRRDNRP